MKKLVLITSLIFGGTSYAQSSAVKSGLWEVKIVRQVVDGKETSAQIAVLQARMQENLAKLSPEQRQQMGLMMGAVPFISASGNGRMCISEAMAARNQAWEDRSGACGSSNVRRIGSNLKFEVKCSREGRSAVGTGKSTIEGDTITSHVELTIADAHGPHTVLSETEMRFIGADCQGVTPADQLAPNMQLSAP